MKFLDKAGLQHLWAAMEARDGATAAADYLVSADPNVIVIHEFLAGRAETASAAVPGENNIVKGFVSGEDKVFVPQSLLRSLNPDTALSAGTLPAGEFSVSAAGADMLFYDNGVLRYCKTAAETTAILTLGGSPALAAADIIIG